MRQATGAAVAVTMDAVAEHAVEFENCLATARGVVEDSQVGNDIRDLFRRQFILPGGHVGRYSRGLASFAYDTDVIVCGAGLDRQMQPGVNFGTSTRAIATLAVTKRAVGLEHDTASNYRLRSLLVYGLA
jgi:hypothetical protein